MTCRNHYKGPSSGLGSKVCLISATCELACFANNSWDWDSQRLRGGFYRRSESPAVCSPSRFADSKNGSLDLGYDSIMVHLPIPRISIAFGEPIICWARLMHKRRLASDDGCVWAEHDAAIQISTGAACGSGSCTFSLLTWLILSSPPYMGKALTVECMMCDDV